MKNSFLIALSSVLFVSCLGHTSHFGRTCPDIKAFPNLSVNKILGEWFVVYQFDTNNNCLVWNITRPIPELDQLEVTETRQIYLLDKIVDHKSMVTGTVDIPNPEIPSRMRVRWPTSVTGKADFIVFDTDYDNYVAIFQCDRAGFFHRRDVTLLARKPEVDGMYIDRVRRLLETSDIAHSSLDEINHNACIKGNTRTFHIDGELFGLLPKSRPANLKIGENMKDIDISEIEIIGDGITSFNGENLKKAPAL